MADPAGATPFLPGPLRSMRRPSNAGTDSPNPAVGFCPAAYAENEFSSLTRQCVSVRPFGDVTIVAEETSAWSTGVNHTRRG